nr:tyrosine-type recombinase/integrase [Odoribacter sp. OF09-27XD]
MKTVGSILGSRVPLTTYVARHSWASIAKRSGIPISVISEGLGHDSEKTTQIYLDSFENNVLDAANEMVTDI